MDNSKFSFLKQTLFFSILGIFISAFTAIPIVLLASTISKFGIECTTAWKTVMFISLIGSTSVLIFFMRVIKNGNINTDYMKNLLAFNLVELTFFQAILTFFILDIKTLCYVTDGQNGLQLFLPGWLSLPILVLISYFFEKRYKKEN